MIRPEIQQYFVESNIDGTPVNREFRSIIYQRAKGQLDTLPFGTQWDVYAVGYEWIYHSLNPKKVAPENARILVGGEETKKPYSCSILNISAMSFGSLGKNAIQALSRGAQLGGFAHNTGEGGLSKYHLQGGGDLIWQVGTGYFGCCKEPGVFDPEKFKEKSDCNQVKMIELKISQGAKPSHGGILPGAKVNEEIALARSVPVGLDVISPPTHSAFHSPIGLLTFVQTLRELSGGKPVGFKMCIGQPHEVLGICKAMVETKILPDFITIDGSEGGTGAAPLEFSNSLGMPLREGLMFVHNALTGIGVRAKIKLFAAGKIFTGFHMFRAMALGADACYSARGMMISIGCIQARCCNNNRCPTGIATTDPQRTSALDIQDKAPRVANYHKETVQAFMELLGAAGLTSPKEIMPHHIVRRMDHHVVKPYDQLFEFIEEGSLISGSPPKSFQRWWSDARTDRF